jgi:hypothetical protein
MKPSLESVVAWRTRCERCGLGVSLFEMRTPRCFVAAYKRRPPSLLIRLVELPGVYCEECAGKVARAFGAEVPYAGIT